LTALQVYTYERVSACPFFWLFAAELEEQWALHKRENPRVALFSKKAHDSQNELSLEKNRLSVIGGDCDRKMGV
jgi:hypothetical protein